MNKKIISSIAKNIQNQNPGWPQGNYEKAAQDTISPDRINEKWNIFLKALPREINKGENLIEIGSGFGPFINHTSYKGINSFGIEPDFERLIISKELFETNITQKATALQSVGEYLPFKSDFFDYVYSHNVIEHVKDPEKVFHEIFRILKPGGVAQIVIPNYGSWWEGHYGLIWIPYMSKSIARLYVKLFGRDPGQIDELQFITYKWINKILNSSDAQVKVLSWGVDIWEERVRSMNFSSWAFLGTLKHGVKLLHRFHIVEVIIWLGKKFHWETPLIITVMKKQSLQ